MLAGRGGDFGSYAVGRVERIEVALVGAAFACGDVEEKFVFRLLDVGYFVVT